MKWQVKGGPKETGAMAKEEDDDRLSTATILLHRSSETRLERRMQT